MSGDRDQLQALRERAAEHNDEIESVRWYTVADLARRWRISETTVRGIPLEELRYKEFGNGEHLKRRRYRSDWVDTYENASGRSAA
jgi:hypothetical protein